MTEQKELPQMDWQQVVLNGGPPCFFVEGPQFCGRTERWQGHGNSAFHNYVSLEQYIQSLTRSQPAEDERLREIRERVARQMEHTNNCAACLKQHKERPPDDHYLLSLLQRCQHGLDVKDLCDECAAQAEFEQSLHPAASTPTENDDPHPGYDCGGTCLAHKYPTSIAYAANKAAAASTPTRQCRSENNEWWCSLPDKHEGLHQWNRDGQKEELNE